MKIALVSEAGGGKDFLAEYLIVHYGFTRYAFADHIRAIAKTLFADQYGDGTSKNRALLQAIGTKFREIDEAVWIKAMLKAIDTAEKMRKKFNYTKEQIVVTDCRMPNEYKALKEGGFVFIRIVSDQDVRSERLEHRGDNFTKNDLEHHSESFYDSFLCDYELINNTTKEAGYAALDDLIAIIQNTTTGGTTN